MDEYIGDGVFVVGNVDDNVIKCVACVGLKFGDAVVQVTVEGGG